MIRFMVRILLAICLVLALTATALAYKPRKVSITAYAKAGIIYTKSCFDEQYPVNEGTVEVRNMKTSELLQIGVTDVNGKWSFPISDLGEKAPDLIMIISAEVAPRGLCWLPAKDYIVTAPSNSAQYKSNP